MQIRISQVVIAVLIGVIAALIVTMLTAVGGARLAIAIVTGLGAFVIAVTLVLAIVSYLDG
jgi:hypothetical protein